MLAKRIIPCHDIRNSRVVKGVNFEGVQDVSDPVELAKFYNSEGADELVFYDITASFEQRKLFSDILQEVAKNIFIPLTVGGGINEINDFDRVLKSGADKVSVNSGAIKNPKLIEEAAKKYGSQCVVLSMDVKRVEDEMKVFTMGGRKISEYEAVSWAYQAQEMGAGEIVVNSIDTDGVKKGFDIEMLNKIGEKLSIPIIASGGAGCIEDFVTLFRECEKVDAGLAASIFHFKQVSISDLKNKLNKSNISVRR
ncbi:MAG: imidazole glycerol phosphate synthase subunit HisF [Clostridia bacterium]|nr:imidazole glycerol phosphate synthase subunit HisF [Clostridia bacterium]